MNEKLLSMAEACDQAANLYEALADDGDYTQERAGLLRDAAEVLRDVMDERAVMPE